MNYYTIDEVVAEAMTVTPNVTDSDRLIARQWVGSALDQLGTSEDEIQVCQIVPKNLLAKKPDDCRKIIDIALYDTNGNLIPHVFRAGKKRIYPNTDIKSITYTNGAATVTYNFADVSEDRFNIVLGTNATDVAQVVIRYFSYPVDSDGMPMIRADEKQAVINYISFCKSRKENESQSQIALAREMWMLEADRARAAKKAFDVSNEKAKTLTSILNRMIPDFNRSKF